MAGSFNLSRHRRGASAASGTSCRSSSASSSSCIAGFAETRRIPFDLPEAESELVAGYHTEYSGMKFGMFFVGEYLGITLISALIVTLFFGGWLGPWLPGVVWFLHQDLRLHRRSSSWCAARCPRPRYDQLMALGWKVMLPLALAQPGRHRRHRPGGGQ